MNRVFASIACIAQRPNLAIWADRYIPDVRTLQPRLPDLRTRLAVTPVATIGLPDDFLFARLIELLFADRGLHVPGEALRFMVERLERDYWAAERAVETVDRFAISERARLTLPTIRRALGEANLISRE